MSSHTIPKSELLEIIELAICKESVIAAHKIPFPEFPTERLQSIMRLNTAIAKGADTLFILDDGAKAIPQALIEEHPNPKEVFVEKITDQLTDEIQTPLDP